MNTSAPSNPIPWWLRQPNFLLAGHLLLLHFLAFGGWKLPAVRILWIVALGLFLLWQPFVAGERRMSSLQGGLLLAVVLASTWLLNPWLMLIWCGALAAVIGGRVLWTSSRLERSGYLLAFGYLVCLIIFGVVPEVSPMVVLDPLPRTTIGLYMPALLALLPLFPAHAQRRQAGDAFDLFYGMLVFLALAVFVLGALAFTFVAGISYVEALAQTSLSIAAALLVLAWAWNPRAGFSGIGSAFSRYLLSVGLPLEQWLIQLAEASEKESHPVRFLATVTGQLEQMPWVVGCRWRTNGDAGELGNVSSNSQAYSRGDVSLTVFFRYTPSPAMRWHVDWLLRLAIEFYLVKFQTHELQRMGYLQAVYETGARVTHDVKNLLQSLQTLCYAAAQPGDPAAVAQLLARQLPQIAERLKSTLDKLQRPEIEVSSGISAGEWWARLQDRHAGNGISWNEELGGTAELPGSLFDSVAENLLQNALAKRQHENGIEISANFTVDRNNVVFSVRDSGQAISPGVADALFREPVQSESGLGIGLYHAAKQAEDNGYCLTLTENRPGTVNFSLERLN
ncbi:MAG: ATP-binding protein [Azonexus sp.]